ncbi:hypothetical protein BYT27DRAFT_7337748 [Phlegmacium glaucopus]|nr:hypothetical protein BYT27DRAFT_7337748 [Phlegmacium glaucopus]
MGQWLKVIGGYSVEQIGGVRNCVYTCICRLDGSHSRAMACPCLHGSSFNSYPQHVFSYGAVP